MSLKDKIKHIYETKYKWLMLITFSIVLLSLLQICLQAATTGDFVNKGITLKGGSTITITKAPRTMLILFSFNLKAFKKDFKFNSFTRNSKGRI